MADRAPAPAAHLPSVADDGRGGRRCASAKTALSLSRRAASRSTTSRWSFSCIRWISASRCRRESANAWLRDLSERSSASAPRVEAVEEERERARASRASLSCISRLAAVLASCSYRASLLFLASSAAAPRARSASASSAAFSSPRPRASSACSTLSNALRTATVVGAEVAVARTSGEKPAASSWRDTPTHAPTSPGSGRACRSEGGSEKSARLAEPA
eukprot:scaffold290905_cov28-Tisochrysis_lutea.AAC.4